MRQTAAHARGDRLVEPIAEPLFGSDLHGQVMLSVHQLGKPTTSQLYRLHRAEIANPQAMRRLVSYLANHDQQYLTCIRPIDIRNVSRFVPHIYIDTTKSRRYVEAHYGVPFRRISEQPSRDIRFLHHDVGMVDELISFELTARTHRMPFAYESHYDQAGKPIYPKVQITHDELMHTLRPAPDKTLFLNGYRIIIEHDCGEETIAISNIIRDATIARKYLAYDALTHSQAFTRLGWDKTLYLYIIEGKKRTQESSQKRVRSCIKAIPPAVDAKRIYFANRHALLEAGDDIRAYPFVRGDGRVAPLPAFK